MIILGFVCAFMSLMQTVLGVFVFTDDVIEFMRSSPDLGTLPDWMIWIFQHLAALSLAAFAVSVATLLAGFGLLRRHLWALRASIGMFWLGAALNVVGIVGHAIFLDGFVTYWPGLPTYLVKIVEANYWTSQISAAAFGLIFAVGFGWTAWKLATPGVRQYFGQSPPGI